MSYFNLLPKTTFTLPNGMVVDSVNILKSAVLSSTFKEDQNIIKKVYYDQVKRLEHVSYRQYSRNMSMYWLVLMLNDIDSFSKVPFSQTLFETTFRETNDGKIYYIKDAVNNFKVLPDDLLLISANNEWKFGGIVKEHDRIFRRIILKKQFENTTNDASVSDNPIMLIYRKQNNSYTLVSDSLIRGRVEDEIDKVIKIYDQNNLSIELSQYSIPSGGFDFSDTPSTTEGSKPLIVDLCNDTITGYKLYTFIEDEMFNNSNNKNLKFTNTALAFKLNTFLSKLSGDEMQRGQVITSK